MKKIIPLLLLATLIGCRQRDMRTTTISIPTVRNEKSIEIVTQAIYKLNGIETNLVTFSDGKVTITYDSMQIGIKNIEHAIKDAGFDANNFKANPKAYNALPNECK